MTTLTDLVCVPTGLRSEFDAVQSLEIEDKPLGGGAFGQNYVCQSMNGTIPPVPGLVIKVLVDDGSGSAKGGMETIRRMQDRLRDLDTARQRRGEASLRDVPGLMALPQFAFEAKLHGKPVCGYAALRLDTLGYVPFDTIADGTDPAALAAYQQLKLKERLQIAGDLAEAFQVLDEIGYVHGDINPQNLFVSVRAARLAVIDFDSGAVIEDPADQPQTWGKPGDWIAPEVMAQLTGKGKQQVRVDALSDRWSFGVGIHYLIFLFHPLFYVRDLGGATLAAYFAGNRWPNIAPHDPSRHLANIAIHARYLGAMPALPGAITAAFDTLLNRGALSPPDRLDGADWVRVLSTTHQAAVIRRFESDTDLIPVGGAVTLTWETEHAQRLFLTGVGDVTGRTTVTVQPKRDTIYTLIAQGGLGNTAVAALPNVQVVQGPALCLRPLPAPPVMPASPGGRPNLSLPGKNVGRKMRSLLSQNYPDMASLNGRGKRYTLPSPRGLWSILRSQLSQRTRPPLPRPWRQRP